MTPEDHSAASKLTDVSTRQDFAQALSSIRETAGLTVRQVADAIDIPASTVGGYFGGRHLPPLSQPHVLTSLLHACGVTDRSAIAQWHELLSEIRHTPGPRPEREQAPYRGLASFRTGDREWFFGRQKLTYAVISRLHQTWINRDGPVAVVGPSGSGKSSLIAAGVTPAFERDEFGVPGSSQWPTVVLTPGHDPVAALAEAFANATDLNAGDIEHELRNDATRGTHFAAIAAASAQTNGILLVIDQLEEAITGTCNEADRWTLLTAVNSIATLPADADGNPAGVAVFGLRADFYHRALGEPLLLRALQRNQVAVGPMTEPELRDAIVQPARRAHIDIEDGLPDVIIKDLTPSLVQDGGLHDIGTLPLLSHTMLATWEHSSGGRMTLANYQATGGIQGSVARTADAVIDTMTQDDQAVARRVFVAMVRISDDAPYTRRRLPRAELPLHVDADPGQLEAVLDTLVDARLVTIDADTVEITHESLVAAWPRLRAWVDADRTELVFGQRLEDAAQAWLGADRDPSLLYRGSMLNTALDWAGNGGRPGAAAREFLNASNRRERNRVRRLYSVIATLCVLTLIAVAGGVYAYQQRADAIDRREEADAARAVATDERNAALSRMVAIRADRMRETDPALARQLALVAYQTSPTLEARSSLLSSSSGPTVTRMLGPDGIMNAIALDSGQSLLAGAGADGSVRLWNMTNSGQPTELINELPGVTGAVGDVALHSSSDAPTPAPQLIAAVAMPSRVVLYDVTDPSSPIRYAELSGPEGALSAVALSPAGTTVAAAGADQTVWLWDTTDPTAQAEPARRLTAPSDTVTSLAFSPDGTELAAGSYDRSVYRWNIKNPAKPQALGKPLTAPSLAVFDVEYSPDSEVLAAASADKQVYRWTISGADATAVSPILSGPTSWVNGVTFSPDGRTIAAAASDGKAWIWGAATGAAQVTLPHAGPLTDVLFEADGQSVYTAAEDGAVRRWELPGPDLDGATEAVHDVAFHPNAPIVALASGDGGVYRWDVTDPHTPVNVSEHLTSGDKDGSLIGAATYHPNGTVLAAAGLDGTVWRWDVSAPAAPEPLSSLPGLDTYAERLAYSPDGSLLAAGAADGTVAVWDVSDVTEPSLVTTINEATSNVIAVAFSPDGRTLAAGGNDNIVWLWDVSDPSDPVLRGEPLTGPTNGVYWLTFAPAGDALAVGSADGTVRLWDVTSPSNPVEGPVLVGPDGYVVGLAYSPSGDRLTAASTDHAVWMWDVDATAEPQLYAVLTGGDAAMHAVSFNHGGNALVAAGQDATGRIWQIDPDQVADHICATSGDPITEAEWEQHIPGLSYSSPC